MIMVLQPKQHFHLVLLFLVASSSSSLFRATHARLGANANPALVPRASNEGANTMLATLLVLFVCAFFITVFSSFYIRCCSERYVVVGNNAVSNTKGIDPEVLATCPIVIYSTIKTGQRHVALQCAVCLGTFDDLDALRMLPKCSHVFHQGCIDMWLASHVTCPVCRTEIKGENGAHQVVGESSMRRVEAGNGGWERVNVDGCIGKSGVLVRSHSTGHSLVEQGKSVERLTKKQIVEDKGGNLMMVKRCASYDTVLQIKEGLGRGED